MSISIEEPKGGENKKNQGPKPPARKLSIIEDNHLQSYLMLKID